MADQDGQTDSLKTVDVTDEASLAAVLAQTLELDDVQTDESLKEVPAEAEADEGNESEVDLSQPEENEADAEDEPAADNDADGEDEAEADDAEPEAEETPRGVQKRIDKLTKRAKEAEEKLADEKAKRIDAENAPAEQATTTAPVTPENPFANLTTLEDVQREEHNAEQVLDWCEDNPDGTLVQTKEGEIDYSAEEVRDIRKKASKAIRKWLPQRQQWVQENQQNEEYAHKTYSWWKDKSAAEYQAASNILREFPEIQRFPDYKVIVGDTLMGMQMRLSQEAGAKKAKKAAPKKAPKQPTAPTAEPAPIDGSAARSSSARTRFDETGDRDDLAQLIAAGNFD